MDFKTFYNDTTLLEFGRDLSQSSQNVAGGVASASKWIQKQVSKPFKFAWDKIKEKLTKTKDDLKNKNVKVVALAEKVYPYDKEKYDKEKASKDIWLNLETLSNGTNIVITMYATVKAQIESNPDTNKVELSITTLDEAADISKVRIAKLKDKSDVERLFQSLANDNSSKIFKWKEYSVYFCMWKNLYDKADKEDNKQTIVTEIIQSGILNKMKLEQINILLREIKRSGQEVNIDNIQGRAGLVNDFIIKKVKEIVDGNGTVLLKTLDIKSGDDTEIDDFIDAYRKYTGKKVVANYNLMADVYAVFKYLSENIHYGRPVDEIINPEVFVRMFYKIKNMTEKVNNKGEREELLYNFLQTIDLGLGKEKVKINKELLDSSEKLFGVLTKETPPSKGKAEIKTQPTEAPIEPLPTENVK